MASLAPNRGRLRRAVAACNAALVVTCGALTVSAQPAVTLPEALEFDYCAWTLSDESVDDLVGRFADDASDLARKGARVARSSESSEACQSRFAAGGDLFAAVLERWHGLVTRGARVRRSKDRRVAETQTAIADLFAADQAARQTYIELNRARGDDAPGWARQLSAVHALATDRRSAEFLTQALQTWDWFDIGRFGRKSSNQAWTLVQHADRAPDLQALALERMEPHLADGNVKAANYAYLWDRVAVNSGRLQRYGTQPVWECVDGTLHLAPLEAPELVNERRAAMGMNSVEDGLRQMSEATCRGP